MKNEAANNRTVKKLVCSVLIGAAAGSAVMTAIIIIATFLILRTQTMNPSFITPLAIAAACAGAFAGGFITAAMNGSMGMASGALCGFLITAVFIVPGLATGSELGIVTLLRLILMTLSGAAGGVAGVNRKTKRRRNR